MIAKKNIINKAITYLAGFNTNNNAIKTKFKNICGKTGQYDIPSELYQKRTSRSNRILIKWKSVEKNNLTLEQLSTCRNGVVVEFVNMDYFDTTNNNTLFRALKDRLGSDDNVSSIISIRKEDGKPSSSIPREAFDILRTEFKDYKNHLIKRKPDIAYRGKGNDCWEGFIYYSIKGGQQDTKESHKDIEPPQLFNPACEYANEEVCLDIDMVMIYFALFSINIEDLSDTDKYKHNSIIENLESHMSNTRYNNMTLLEYCKNHICLSFNRGYLTDPIQAKQISIQDFAIDDGMNRIDITHNEAVTKDKYYFDYSRQCILSAARPTNLFWSIHMSNMMQQDFTLQEFFKFEEDLVEKRKSKKY